MVSPITLAVVSEDGRGTSARIEIVEAARGVMQLAGRSGDERRVATVGCNRDSKARCHELIPNLGRDRERVARRMSAARSTR
jgi:hypothetical protein